MPKIYNTRTIKAIDLFKRISEGPSIRVLNDYELTPDDRKEYQHQYDIWFETWISPILLQFIPELRKPKALQQLKDKGLVWFEGDIYEHQNA